MREIYKTEQDFERFAERLVLPCAREVSLFLHWCGERSMDPWAVKEEDVFAFFSTQPSVVRRNPAAFIQSLDAFVSSCGANPRPLQFDTDDAFFEKCDHIKTSELQPYYITNEEFRRYRELISSNAREAVLFDLVWYGYTSAEIVDLKKEDVVVRESGALIKDRLISDAHLASSILEALSVNFLMSPFMGTMRERSADPDYEDYVIKSSRPRGAKTSATKFVSQIMEYVYLYNPIPVPISVLDLAASGAAWFYTSKINDFKNTSEFLRAYPSISRKRLYVTVMPAAKALYDV